MDSQPLESRSYQTAVVAIPPEEVWPTIQEIRSQYDTKFARWMPHITLFYPFWPRTEWPKAIELFSAVCCKLRPFTISFSSLGKFSHGRDRYTLWLEPASDQNLEKLHATLASMLPSEITQNEHSRFIPHLSVGQVKGRKKMEDLRISLQRNWRPITFTLSHVSLLWRNDPPDDVFRVGETVALTKS